MRGGRFDTEIRIKRRGAAVRDGRSMVPGAPATVVETLAMFLPAVGSERFASAQNIASAPAVFVIRRQADTEGVDTGDLVTLVEFGTETQTFDIKSVRPWPTDPRRGLEISAIFEGERAAPVVPIVRPPLPRPLVFSSFADGIYRVDGADVGLSDVWYENGDWSPFDPLDIVPGVGFKPPLYGGPCLVRSLVGRLDRQAGFVVVLDYVMAGSAPRFTTVDLELVDLPNYAQGSGFQETLDNRPGNGTIPGAGSYDYSSGNPLVSVRAPELPPGRVKTAAYFSDAKLAFSRNGEERREVAVVRRAVPTDLCLYAYGSAGAVNSVSPVTSVSIFGSSALARLEELSVL